MGLDVDYIAGHTAVEEMEKMLSNTPHGKREAIADRLIEMAEMLKAELKAESKKPTEERTKKAVNGINNVKT